MGMRTAAIIVARAASTRLPGKMILPFGRSTVVETVVERMRECQKVADFIFATSTSPHDDVFAPLIAASGLPMVRGSENDVVARMMAALDALSSPPDIIVRVCADNPMVMPAIVDDAIGLLLRTGADLVTPFEFNTLPFGYGMVVMTAGCLRRIDRDSVEAVHREHVENFCFDNPEKFRIAYQVAPDGCAMPRLGLSLDYSEDYHRLRHAWDLVADVPARQQHDLLLNRLRQSRVAVVGRGGEADHLAAAMAGWLAAAPAVIPEGHSGFDLLVGLDGPLPEAALGAFWVDDGVLVDAARRVIATLPSGGLIAALPDLMPVLLGGYPRPEHLRPDGLPPADKLGSGRRRGFASRQAASLPLEIFCAPDLADSLRARIVAEAPGALRDGSPPPLAIVESVFRRLYVGPDGSLSHDGLDGRNFARLDGISDSLAAAWRGAAMARARAAALNSLLETS